jgi:hypothetical protein
MKIRTTLITVSLFAFSQTVRSQTAEQWITRGRTNLVATNLVAANLCFSNAVRLSYGQQTGNVFYAATRLLVWPSQPTGSNFLNRLGVTNAGRNIYNWMALPPTDTNGVPVPPQGVNASDFAAMLRTNILTQLIGAESNLANVTGTNFVLSLTSNETRSVAVTLDDGDVRLLRAMLQAAEYACYTAHEWNLDAPLAPLYSLYTNGQFSLERLLADHPGLLTFATTNDLAAAKAALLAGVNRYNEASQFIRSRSTNVVRLFNYDPEKAASEANFRQTLADLTNSLTHAVTLAAGTNYTVFLGSLFSGTHPLRQFLPVIRGNGFALGTLPDPSFGGLVYSTVPGTVEDNVEEFLARGLFPIPTIAPELSRAGPQFQFPIHTLKNRGYTVEVSTNLHDWVTSYAFFSFADGYLYGETNAYASPRRFYRVADCTENMPPPPNDSFANRTPLTGLGFAIFGYNSSATTEPGEPGYPWDSVWWSWTAPDSGVVAVGVIGGTAWQSAQVYTGTSLTNLTQVAGDSQPFYAIAGTTYQIQVSGDPGGIRLVITAPPTLMVTSPQDSTASPAPTNFTISAWAADSDGSISNLTFYADGNQLASVASTSLSMVWSNVGTGVHSIEVDATDNLGMTTWSNMTVYVRPPNDNFANRILISGSSATVTGTTDGASKEPGEPDHAGYSGGTSVWWSWTSPLNGYVTISSDMVNPYDSYFASPLLAVYTGISLSSLLPIASSTPGNPFWDHAQVSFVATAGLTYQIAIDNEHPQYSYWQNGTTVTLRLIPTEPPLVSITSPMDGAAFTGPTNLTITASATDHDGVIRRVDFYNYSMLIGSATNRPYSIVLTGVSGATWLSLTAKATDNMGASTYSDTVNIHVVAPEITLSLTTPLTNLSGQQGSETYYVLTVPSGLDGLQIDTHEGTGDCDLYVAYGYQPSLSQSDYRSVQYGNNESVTINYPSAGDWHIMLYGYSGYSGLTLEAWTW